MKFVLTMVTALLVACSTAKVPPASSLRRINPIAFEKNLKSVESKVTDERVRKFLIDAQTDAKAREYEHCLRMVRSAHKFERDLELRKEIRALISPLVGEIMEAQRIRNERSMKGAP